VGNPIPQGVLDALMDGVNDLILQREIESVQSVAWQVDGDHVTYVRVQIRTNPNPT
jgi:hypothetical protein